MTILCHCLFQESVATKSVPSCTSIQSPKSKTAPGTTEASANTVGPERQLTSFHANTEHEAHRLLLGLCLRSGLQTQTHETSDLCQLPGGLLSRRKVLQIHAVCNHVQSFLIMESFGLEFASDAN